jgi:hypothetical protein
MLTTLVIFPPGECNWHVADADCVPIKRPSAIATGAPRKILNFCIAFSQGRRMNIRSPTAAQYVQGCYGDFTGR